MKSKKLPAEVFVTVDEDTDGSTYLSADRCPGEGMIAGEQQVVGRYQLVETLTVAVLKIATNKKRS